MQLKPELQRDYDEYVAKNNDPYGAAVVRYEKAWAELMEAKLAAGSSLAGCWKEASHEADTEGITGFMYGCAVQSLAHFWAHGDELRRLHNADYGVSEEKAQGGTVNPAVLTIG